MVRAIINLGHFTRSACPVMVTASTKCHGTLSFLGTLKVAITVKIWVPQQLNNRASLLVFERGPRV